MKLISYGKNIKLLFITNLVKAGYFGLLGT